MKEFVKVMKTLSAPNRVKILKMLQQKELCVFELQAALGMVQPTLSKHLTVFDEAGLVLYRKDRLWVDYYLADGSSSLMRLRFWGTSGIGWKTNRR